MNALPATDAAVCTATRGCRDVETPSVPITRTEAPAREAAGAAVNTLSVGEP